MQNYNFINPVTKEKYTISHITKIVNGEVWYCEETKLGLMRIFRLGKDKIPCFLEKIGKIQKAAIRTPTANR